MLARRQVKSCFMKSTEVSCPNFDLYTPEVGNGYGQKKGTVVVLQGTTLFSLFTMF